MSTPQDQDQDSSMKIPISPTRASTLTQNLSTIQSRIAQTKTTNNITKPIRLIAVSKLKPASDILALHQPPTSHLHFGENYVQELIEKASLLPPSIKWSFIGGLQSNKCRDLAKEIPNLWAVNSIDTVKKAKLLDKGRGEIEVDPKSDSEDKDTTNREPLRVFIQINTSNEASKSGVEPKSQDLLTLIKTITTECHNLKLQGLMTIGAIARSKATTSETENEDFESLRENRDWIAEQTDLQVRAEELELSMGMSEDFEGAIVAGSDEVRVGSTIFGERPPKKEARVLEHTEEEKE